MTDRTDHLYYAERNGKRIRVQSPTYLTWSMMRQRCQNPKATKYPQYGAKGVQVCERWQSFDCFLADMGVRPDGKTLDRIDGSKGYSPDNCQWATPGQQQRNLKSNIRLTYDGVDFIRKDLAAYLGVGEGTLIYRIKSGWPQSEWGRPAMRVIRRLDK